MLTPYEKETIIIYNNEEDSAKVYTYHAALQNKLQKFSNEYDEISMLRSGEGWVEYTMPKTWVKISPKKKCNWTDEQRAAASERLATARNKRDC